MIESTVHNPTPSTELLTAEQFAELPGEPPCELIRGKVVPVCRTRADHGSVAARITFLLAGHVYEQDLGDVSCGDTGHVVARGPDTVRGPDVGFIGKARIPAAGLPDPYWEGSPDLAVEVLSPHDRDSEVEEKTQDWLAGGAQEIWLGDPRRQEINVIRPGMAVVLARLGDTLHTDLLPGLELAVASVFGSD